MMILRAFVIGLLLGAIMMSGSTLAHIVGNPIVVYIESPEEIQRGWEAEIGKESERVAGWALYRGAPPDIWGCEIHVPPMTPETAWVWVHEFKHCTEGDWHPEKT